VILLYLLVKGKRNVISLADINKIKFELSHIRSILSVGIPSGIEHSLFQLGKILVSRVAAGFGTAAIAANAVTGSINSIVIMPGNAIGVAMLIIVSQFIGAGDFTGAKRITKRLMILTHVVMFIVCVCNMIFMNKLVALFNLGPEAHGLAVSFLRLLAVMMIIAWPGSFALPSALRAAGDAKYIMFVAIVSVWLVRVLGAQFLSVTLGAGPIGIWYAWVADWVFRSAFFIPRWLKSTPFQKR
jgi:Na+-driven multidrug efflux pump